MSAPFPPVYTMSHQSPLIEINVNHIKDCLHKNGLVPRLEETLNEGEAATSATSSPTSDEFKHLLVVKVIRLNTHIVEQILLADEANNRGLFMLPQGVGEIVDILRPLYSFVHGEHSIKSLVQFESDVFGVLQKLADKQLDNEDSLIVSLKWLSQKICFAVWCLNQTFSLTWCPKTILDLCTQQPSSLNTLKTLGGLQLVNQQDISSFLGNCPSSMDVYRGFLALNGFIKYLFKHFQLQKGIAPQQLEEVDDVVGDIDSKEIRLQVLEDMFSLCFLRKEDILFEDTASDSGGEIRQMTTECSKSKRSDPSCPSNSNSPNNTQTGTSSATLAGKRSDMSLGFLCTNSKKLEVCLSMLKRRLEALQFGDDGELSLHHRKLERRVSQALWRLQLVEDDQTANYFSRRPVENTNNQEHGNVVRKAWLSRLNPSVQTWYGYSPGRRKFRTPPHLKKTRDGEPVDPLLMNRLLADPLSLMTLSMMKSHLTAARQVADLYQLWETPEGRELHFSLAHAAAAKELERTGRQLIVPTSSDDSARKNVIDSLGHVRLPSAVETQLSTLQRATVPSLTADDDWQSAVLVADLINSSNLSPPEVSVQLLDFALKRIEGTVDLDVEPWRTLRRYAECSNLHLERTPWLCPVQSHLPLDRQLLHDHAQRLQSTGVLFKELVEALSGLADNDVDMALENFNNSLQSVWSSCHDDSTTTPFLRMRYYLQVIRKLAPSHLRMRGVSASRLLEHDIGMLIVERLREEPDLVLEMETIARTIGIELPSFLAGSICSSFDGANVIDLSDQDFVVKLVTYLHTRCPLLAQVVELQLQIEHGVQLPAEISSSIDCSDIESMDIFRRYLQRPSKSATIDKKSGDAALLPPVKQPYQVHGRVRRLPDSPSPITDTHNSLLVESEEEPTVRLGALILAAIPATTANQLEHLLSQPLLIIEQLLMNSQIGLATDLVKLVRLNGQDDDAEEINQILLRYAAKALALGLPDLPSSPAKKVSDKESGHQVAKAKKKINNTFVLPAAAPAKENWIADADVSQCPCCQTVQFSMFDRRHHCRRCGRVVCAHCSPHRRLVDGYGDVPVRTCNDCHSSILEDGSDSKDIRSSVRRSSNQDGQLVWCLSLDDQHNQIARREFSYEHAPNLALALAMVHLCDTNQTMANFLLDQSSSMLATLHRYLVHGTLMDVCSDPLMMFSLIKSLILSAKMRYADIIAAPGQQGSKGKPSRGLARCDALLGQIDLLSLLASANSLHLLPPQPMSQLDTWRKLRDRLIDIELWSLALDVSTKAGLDAGSVWAAWGLVCLKAGNFQGARQRFQRCLKPSKVSPLLQEILTVLESLSIPCASLPGNTNENSPGSMWSSKRSRRLSSPSSQPSPVFNCDNPQLIVASLSRLNDICCGHLVESEDKDCILEEILFYLGSYGQPESPYAYLVEKSGRIDLAVQRFASTSRHPTADVFNQGLLLPCLKSSQLEDLIIEMKRHDASFHSWKAHLLAAAQLLESKCFWNSLYQLHCLSGDWIRASLVAIRRLYLNDLFSVETLVGRSHLLQDIEMHLNQFLAGPLSHQKENSGESDKQLPLWWPENEVTSLQKTVQLQMKVTTFLDTCLKDGKLSGELLAVVKSVTQSPDGISGGPSAESNNTTGVYLIPTLLGSRQFRCSSAVLVTCASPDPTAFELSWKICTDLRVRLDRYFRLAAFVLIRRGLVPALIQLVEFIKARIASQSIEFFDIEELLVECATLIQERDKTSRSPDLEQVVQLIKKSANKIRVFINLGWLKAAYLLAVRNGQKADVIHIQQEATRLQQVAVLALCDKWLRARNVPK